MKLIKLVAIFFFALSHSLWALDFDQIIGCYETKLIDNQVPNYSDRYLRTLTTIERDISPSFSTLENHSLEHVIINLYTGSNGVWDSYHPFVLFPDLGETISEELTMSYLLNDDLLLWQNFRQIKVDHFTGLRIRKLQDNEIEGEVFFQSQRRQMSGKRQFRLKKILCF